MGRTLLSLCGDLVIFIGFLILTTVYPLWNDITGRKGKHTKSSYVFATGRVSMVPMMFSIARGCLSVRSLLGKKNMNIGLIIWLCSIWHVRSCTIQSEIQPSCRRTINTKHHRFDSWFNLRAIHCCIQSNVDMWKIKMYFCLFSLFVGSAFVRTNYERTEEFDTGKYS